MHLNRTQNEKICIILKYFFGVFFYQFDAGPFHVTFVLYKMEKVKILYYLCSMLHKGVTGQCYIFLLHFWIIRKILDIPIYFLVIHSTPTRHFSSREFREFSANFLQKGHFTVRMFVLTSSSFVPHGHRELQTQRINDHH